MDSSSIELPGSEIESITLNNGTLTVRFSRAYIIKTMTGSVERTRWWQPGILVFSNAEMEGSLPTGPFICAGGDVSENIYTYRDMIPIPLESRGRAGCKLRLAGFPNVVATATGIRLILEAVPRYIEHIRPEATPTRSQSMRKTRHPSKEPESS
ncbi:conserved hypothetical protein [Gammaproteobacteria bacterium]